MSQKNQIRVNESDSKLVRKFRIQAAWRGITNAELADEMGVHHTDIAKYRRGQEIFFLKDASRQKIKEWLSRQPYRPVDQTYKAVCAEDGVHKKGGSAKLIERRAIHEAAMREFTEGKPVQHPLDWTTPVVERPKAEVVPPRVQVVADPNEVTVLWGRIRELEQQLADTRYILNAVRKGEIK